MASIRRSSNNADGGKSGRTTVPGLRVVGTQCKCQRLRTAINLFGSCAFAAKQDHHHV